MAAPSGTQIEIKMNKKKQPIKEIFNSAFENHKKNNLKIAENLYKEIIKIKPDHIDSIFYLGGLLTQKREFLEAKELFEKVVEINPKYPNINNNLCAVYKMLANISSINGKLLEAKKFFEKILTLDPNNLDSAYGYGVLLLKLNQHNKGLNYIRKGTSFIRFTPDDCKII